MSDHFIFKIKSAVSTSVFVLLLLSCFSGLAQSAKEDVFVDYEALNMSILGRFKAIKDKTPFISSTELRKITLALGKGAKAKIENLPKVGKKQLSGAEIYKARKNGVLMICKLIKSTKDSKERVDVIASGTALTEDGYCVSNWHVFLSQIQPDLNVDPTDSITFVVTSKGDVYPIEKISAFNIQADAAIFKVNTGKNKLDVIPMGTDLDVGETVYTISHPDGYFYYYTSGIVARNRANHDIGPMANRMEITADYAKGSSGGPIIDDRGNMAGMVSTTHSVYYNYNVDLQMVMKTTIPIRSIKTLIEK